MSERIAYRTADVPGLKFRNQRLHPGQAGQVLFSRSNPEKYKSSLFRREGNTGSREPDGANLKSSTTKSTVRVVLKSRRCVPRTTLWEIVAMQYRIRIDAGQRRRAHTPFTVFIPDLFVERPTSVVVENEHLFRGSVDLYPADGGSEIVGIIHDLAPGRSIEFSLASDRLQPAQDTENGVSFESDAAGSITVTVGGRPFTTLVTDPSLARPFFFPVYGPTGEPVTRRYPMMDPAPDEADDHPHHRSFWVAYGDVNGLDFWSENKDHGVQQVEGTPRWAATTVAGLLEHTTLWRHRDTPILRDRRSFRFFHVPGDIRMFDVRLQFSADFGKVRFGDTKEGGLIAFRVAGSMKGKAGGRITNAFGGIGERECWGVASPWVDYSGPTGATVQGITILDHPLNFRYPTRWHVRDYGLFAVNPLALSYYKQSFKTDGSFVLEENTSLTMNYRVVIHEGDADQAGAAAFFADYLYPPKVSVDADSQP